MPPRPPVASQKDRPPSVAAQSNTAAIEGGAENTARPRVSPPTAVRASRLPARTTRARVASAGPWGGCQRILSQFSGQLAA